MSELIDKLRRYALIHWETLRTNRKETARYGEGSFNSGFVMGLVEREVGMLGDLRDTFPNLDNESGSQEVSVESLRSYTIRQRDRLKQDQDRLKGMVKGSHNHDFTCGMIAKGKQVIIDLYVTCPELGNVDRVPELWET